MVQYINLVFLTLVSSLLFTKCYADNANRWKIDDKEKVKSLTGFRWILDAISDSMIAV